MKKYNLYLKLVKLGNKLGCHQISERSFYYKGYQFPICARCSGIYLGNIIGIFIYIKIPIILLILLASLTFIDGFIQLLTSYKSNNYIRFITGIISGIAIILTIKTMIIKYE